MRFDFALSFAGPERARARALAVSLRSAGYEVFFDEFFEHEMLGVDGSRYLRRVYTEDSRFCVVLISRDYDRRDWTNLEREAIQSRELRGERDILLPVVTDGHFPEWLPATRIYFDATQRDEEKLLSILQQRAGSPRHGPRNRLRKTPATLSGDETVEVIKKLDLFHPRFNPLGRGLEHIFTTDEHTLDENDPLAPRPFYSVRDLSTGLAWSLNSLGGTFFDGPPCPLLSDVDELLASANERKLGGADDWRLPTVEEAASLISPEVHHELYLPDAFHGNSWKIWTLDRNETGARWLVQYRTPSFFAATDERTIAFVKAVRTLGQGGRSAEPAACTGRLRRR